MDFYLEPETAYLLGLYLDPVSTSFSNVFNAVRSSGIEPGQPFGLEEQQDPLRETEFTNGTFESTHIFPPAVPAWRLNEAGLNASPPWHTFASSPRASQSNQRAGSPSLFGSLPDYDSNPGSPTGIILESSLPADWQAGEYELNGFYKPSLPDEDLGEHDPALAEGDQQERNHKDFLYQRPNPDEGLGNHRPALAAADQLQNSNTRASNVPLNTVRSSFNKDKVKTHPRRAQTSRSARRKGVDAPREKCRGRRRTTDNPTELTKEVRQTFVCEFHWADCPKTFATKNEWKRHVATTHLVLQYWNCPKSRCGQDFSRCDLFQQHIRRMHPLEGSLAQAPQLPHILTRDLEAAAVRQRCQAPTYLRCPVLTCQYGPFVGPEAWNERMEHVAVHLERVVDGTEPPMPCGFDADPTLAVWAVLPHVAVVQSRLDGGWQLLSPLKKKKRTKDTHVTAISSAAPSRHD